MIDNTNLLDRIEASLTPKEDCRALAQVFALGKVFRDFTNDADLLIFLDTRARDGSRSTFSFHSKRFIYSEDGEHLAHQLTININIDCTLFDYQRAFRSELHEERLHIQYKRMFMLVPKD